MQRLFLFALISLIGITACNQKSTSTTEKKDSVATVIPPVQVDSSLQKIIYAFVEAYANKSNADINNLIHPDLGLHVIYRPGAADVFSHIHAFDYEKPVPNNWDYEAIKNEYSLSFDALPEYDCGLERWSKVGLYCDSTLRPNQLSQIIDFETEFGSVKYSAKNVNRIKEEEAESHRVILTGEYPLIFHVRRYQGNWYVTVLDRAYAGCDA